MSDEVENVTAQVTEEEKKIVEDETQGVPVEFKRPQFNVMSLNRKSRRQFKMPLTMWGVYDMKGNLMTVGTFNQASQWAHNHRRVAVNHKGMEVQKDVKGKFAKMDLHVRPILMTTKDAFKSPIDLSQPCADLKAVK